MTNLNKQYKMTQLKHFISTITLFLVLGCSPKTTDIAPHYLRIEYKNNPYIDTQIPRFSWELQSGSRNQKQTAYQILVASSLEKLNNENADLWNTQKTISSETFHIEYAGKKLESRQKAFWKVRAWDANNIAGEWSEAAHFEMTLLNKSDWNAEWIGYDLSQLGKGKVYHLPPSPYIRKTIKLRDEIKEARLYVTALGLYEFSINGSKVGNAMLTPGWTDYDKRIYYQTYDVTNLVHEGKNAMGALLSYGWYAGYVGYALLTKQPKVRAFYGEVPKLLAQLEITYANGETARFVTDKTWKAKQSAIVESDLLNGESYDAREEIADWNTAYLNDETWDNVQCYENTTAMLQVHPGNKVVVTDTIAAKEISVRPDNKYIFNMGQNFAGIVKLKVKGRNGQKIVLRYGEMLHPDGSLMTENLRMARATDTYICKGLPTTEEWTPRFTFHGFQYVEISGLDYKPGLNAITGLALSSDNPTSGSFECDNAMLNQLYSNIVWTQKANFIDIPTDCPQRDERLGWTGDAQIYISSAIMNNDVAGFFTKWITDLNDAQWEYGAYPNFAPKPYFRAGMDYSPGWMEAGIICPYHIFKAYGDKRLIETAWPNMTRFMDFHAKQSAGKFMYPEASFENIRPKGGFSDWLSVGTKTSPDLLASMYYGYCANLMAQMAEGINKPDEAAKYRALFESIKTSTLKHYLSNTNTFTCNNTAYGDGTGYVDGELGFTGHTQTAYANAIYMDFLNDAQKADAGKNLKALIEENGNKLTTGFLGVKPLLPALSFTNNTQTAYTLLLNKNYPSWGFEIENGATSVWERWNSYTKENGFMAGMNSFSHYSFGAVYEWIFNTMAGIKNTGIAYNHITIAPELDPRLSRAKVNYRTMHGNISVEWISKGDTIAANITIPVNTTALIKLPATKNQEIYEANKRIKTTRNNNVLFFEIGSGTYNFVVK